MGKTTEFFGALGTIEIISGRVSEDKISYSDKKGQPATFVLRQQPVVFRRLSPLSHSELVAEGMVSLARDRTDPYPPGLYVCSGASLKVSDRGRLEFGRDVVLLPIPDEVQELIQAAA